MYLETDRNVVNLFIFYELDIYSKDLSTEFTLGDCFFGAMNLTKNAHPDKHGCSGDGIGFDARSQFLLPHCEWVKNVISGVDNSLSLHANNRKKYPSF